MSDGEPAGGRLARCLARMESLLETGAVLEAAALVDELNAGIAAGLEPMTDSELAAVRQSLVHCVGLEAKLRRTTLEALQRLGAGRRTQAYRNP